MQNHDTRGPGRVSPALFVLAASLFGSFACQSSERAPARVRGASPEAAGVVPEARRLQADVAYLADDALEGRRAGTAGEQLAGDYIAQRFAELGLRPAGEDGYFQSFSVPLTPRDGGGSWVRWSAGGEQFERRGDHLAPLFCSAAGEARGALRFCGYGIWDDELGLDEFGAPVEGDAIALILRGTPPFDAPVPAAGEADGEPSWGGVGSLFLKVMNAKRKGYAGVLIAQHPFSSAGAAPDAFDPTRGARAPIPALMISSALAEVLVPNFSQAVQSAEERDALPRAEAMTALPDVELDADVVRGEAQARNVLARLPGRDAARTVVLGAHYDHLGRGGPGSLARDEQGEVHNGADDNASGTAVVLELARVLAAGPEPEGDVIFALWSGEELGLLGSRYWVEHPTVPLEDVACNFNFDMVGRANGGKLSVLGAGTSPAFATWMEAAASMAELELDVSLSPIGVGGSDHQSFIASAKPALHFFSGVHSDYHRPSDDIERFEADGARRVTELARLLLARAQDEEALPFVEVEEEETSETSPSRSGGWRARFGSIPSYGADVKGLLLDGTSPGGPAEKAGLLKGDIVVQIGDVEIEDIHGLVYALNVYKPGNVVKVRFLRDGEEQEVLATLESAQAE